MGKNYLNWDKYKRPDAGADKELDDTLDRCRAAYTNGLDAMLEALVIETGDAKIAQYVAQDFAMFAAFLVTTKMVELAGANADRQQLLSAFDYLRTRMEREIPEQLLTLAQVVAAAEAEDGGTVQ